MINKYINEHIDQSVNVEPNFNKIDHSINYEQFNNIKRFSKNNILRFISILCPTCIMIIGTVLLINNLIINKKIVNEYISSNQPTIPVPFSYKISTKKSSFSYDETIEIDFELGLDSFLSRMFQPSDMTIKIEDNDFYEIINQQEYVFENTIIENKDEETVYYKPFISDYFSTNDNKYPIKLKYFIKPTKDSFRLSSIDFSIKVKFSEDFKNEIQTQIGYNYNYLGSWWFDFDEDYKFNIRAMYFINENKLMKLSLNYKKILEVYLNEPYEKEEIDKDIYMDRLINSLVLGNVAVQYYQDGTLCYISENIKFKISMENNFYEKIINLMNERKNKEVAINVLNYLNDNIDIPSQLYELELNNINKNTVIIDYYPLPSNISFNIPFNDYKNYIFDYEYSV